jgi:chemotaxis family two-component system response regulator Rcp1
VLKLINPQTEEPGTPGKVFEILLIEDNRGDIILAKENLKKLDNIKFNLTIISDGAEAINYLNHFPGFEVHSEPDLVLLDLDLPKRDGWEILREMKGNINLSKIPVCILTGFEQDFEVLGTCTVLTRHFMCKPLDADRIKELLEVK